VHKCLVDRTQCVYGIVHTALGALHCALCSVLCAKLATLPLAGWLAGTNLMDRCRMMRPIIILSPDIKTAPTVFLQFLASLHHAFQPTTSASQLPACRG